MDFPYSSQSDIDYNNKAISSLDDEDPLFDHSIANTLSDHDGSQENCSPLFGVDGDDVYNNHIEFNQVQHDHHQQEEPQPPCFAPMITMMTKQTVSDQQYLASSSTIGKKKNVVNQQQLAFNTTVTKCSELMDLLNDDELSTSTSSSAATVVANSPQIRRKPIKASNQKTKKRKGQKKSQNDAATMASDELSTTSTNSSSSESTSRKRSTNKRAQNQIETESCKEAVASEKKKKRESDAHHEQLNLNQEDFIKTITVDDDRSILEVKYDVESAHRPFRTADKLSITLNDNKVEFTVEERQHFSKRAGLGGRLYNQPLKSNDGVLELDYTLFVDDPTTRRAGTYRVLIDVGGIKIIVRFIIGQKGGGGDLRLKSMQVEQQQQVFERII